MQGTGCDAVVLHREYPVTKQMQLDVITANEKRAKQIITNALKAESEHGTIWVAQKKDLIWMKKQRNSDQDKVDIKKLKDTDNEKN